MKLIAKLGATAVIAGTALAIGAPTASANSIATTRVAAGTYQYSDYNDSFCATANRGNSVITVTLTAVSRSGPTKVFSAEDGGRACGSLAKAYEDTKYKAVISSWVNGARSSKTVYFYS